MNFSLYAPRLLAGFSTAALVAAVGLFASSRPAHTAGGPIPVAVSNLPLPTTPTDEAAPQQPFQGITEYLFSDGSSVANLNVSAGFTNITVPAGKRLVIQTVGVYCTGANGQSLQGFIQPTADGQTLPYLLPLVTDNGMRYSGATQSLTLSADPGSDIRFLTYRRGTSGTEVVVYSVYGYLVNAT